MFFLSQLFFYETKIHIYDDVRFPCLSFFPLWLVHEEKTVLNGIELCVSEKFDVNAKKRMLWGYENFLSTATESHEKKNAQAIQ